jgi:hypothetical protein
MALLDSELARIRYELGFPVLATGAEPYVGITALFDQVVKPYLLAGASTTSTTSVSAATSATPAALTLASASGVAAGARVVIDVDDRQEVVTVQSVSGSAITVLLTKAHSGTYPVTVEGGESIVREILGRLRAVGGQIEAAMTRAGVKRVDEIELFGESGSKTTLSGLQDQQRHWRAELERVLFGDKGLGGRAGGGGGSFSLY